MNHPENYLQLILNENPNSEGKADLKILIQDIAYIIELKYYKKKPSKTAKVAMERMKTKKYAEAYQATNETAVYLLAIVFVENSVISKTLFEKWDKI